MIDLPNAYELSRLETPRINEEPKAAELTRQGKFVVMGSHDVTCRLTDAFLHVDYFIVEIFDNEQEAVDFVGDSDFLYIYRERVVKRLIVEDAGDPPF